MPRANGKFDASRIREELERIIINGIGHDDVHSIPHDIPILDLGINSLALVDGMRQVYDHFGVLVSIRRVIEGQITIGSLALYIEQELSSQQLLKQHVQTTSQWQTERQVPLAPSQQHIGFLTRYSNEANAAHNVTLSVRLNGALHGPALHAAIEEVGNRYESLRTLLSPDQNTLDVGKGETLELIVSPVSSEQLQERLTDIVTRPFEIGKRLFRAELLRLSEAEHVLALISHGLVLESRALRLILKEIADLYQVFSHDQNANAVTLTLQWTDYLALGDTTEAKEAKKQSEDYWQRIFDSGVPLLELPTDHPRPAIKKYSGSRMDLQLDPAINKRLRVFANSENVSPETVLLAAFSIFMHRLSGLDDIVVGVESERLYLDDNAPAIANTRDMLPLRMQYDAAKGFREYIHAQAGSLAQVNLHRNLSFAELVQLLDVPRDQSRSPLFTVAFRAQQNETTPVFEGLECEYLSLPASGARYDLELLVQSQNEMLILLCDYSTELFEEETITRWLNGMVTMLDSGLQDASQACDILPVMTSREREKILFEWNKTGKVFPREQTVFDAIRNQALASSEATAVRYEDSLLNYGQLMERVEQIAGALHHHGIKCGDRVGILMKRSLDLIPSLLAVWRVGAVYVPVDIGFPKQRIAYVFSDADVQIVVTNREVSALVEELGLNTLCVEDIATYMDSNLEYIESANGSDSAYIMYTSGSTGKPKGVEIKHSALLNCLMAVTNYVEFTSESSMLALTTISFDISTAEIFMPLMAGGYVELGEDGLVADGIRLVERIESCTPSHIQLTPSCWKVVLSAGWDGRDDTCLLTTGEAISRDLAEQVLQRCRALWNLYGPTETTVYSSACRIESAPHEPIRIGRPLPNTQMYILDKNHQPVPIGAVGDLYIAGEGLAIAYWQRPELTAERFIENPFRAGEQMYFTGDLARYLPDGSIVCLGRLDDQVKIHGVRVELGEVESALRGIAGVQDAVVVSWQDARGDSQLVAHVILDDKDITAHKLRTHLREQLPEVMVPPYILFTDSFPKTASGKIQRAALPASNAAHQEHADQGVEPPATVTERRLANGWASILGIDPKVIGRDSDFMDLGGHSLLMTLLIVEVRKLFQVTFHLREFFSAPTLRKFAALIDERRPSNSGQRPNIGRTPASARTSEWARQRMAFLQREAELPRYIAPARGMAYQPAKEIKNVLLTGGTGFLGVYVIAEILKTTQSEIYCLVRPKRGEDSKKRIENQMKRYQVWVDDEAWHSSFAGRLHVVNGNVTLPRLGMNDTAYETLSREVGAIFHGAAHVNFIYPYEALRATNVLGVHEIIQFAFHGRIKPVHHLSTAAIWPMGSQYTYYEKDPIDHGGLLNLGYDEAKWVGEKCLLHAQDRGLPVARYRPGEVGGDSLTGRCVTDHFLIACFKGFLQFGAFPDLDIEVDVAPVDYVAKALVYLAFQRDTLGRAFHLTNPSRRRLKDGLEYLRNMGYQFEELPFVELRDRLINNPDFSSNALFAYQAALDDMDNMSMQLPTYDTRETRHELAGSGILCPPADEKLFGTYLRFLQEIGFIPLPQNLSASVVVPQNAER